MLEPEPDRGVLLEALVAAYGLGEAWEIMADPSAYCAGQREPGPVWLSLEGCWMFHRWGMAIGVERDGYVHS